MARAHPFRLVVRGGDWFIFAHGTPLTLKPEDAIAHGTVESGQVHDAQQAAERALERIRRSDELNR